jgi:aldehyde dehydrogenase (NAD+)
VVEADANIKVAARRIVMTKFSNAGQMCGTRFSPGSSFGKRSVDKRMVAVIKSFSATKLKIVMSMENYQ